MKTLRISDNVHRKLTRWFGQMMAESGKAKTYSDVMEALVSQAVLLSPELVAHIDEFIEDNKKLGHVTREEFLREAVNEKLTKRYYQRISSEVLNRRGIHDGEKSITRCQR